MQQDLTSVTPNCAIAIVVCRGCSIKMNATYDAKFYWPLLQTVYRQDTWTTQTSVMQSMDFERPGEPDRPAYMLKVKTPIRVGSGLLGLSSCVSILIATPFESHLLHSVTHTDIICTHTPLYSFLFCHLLLWHANAPNENKYILLLSPNRQQGGTFFTVTAYLNNLATEKNVIIIDRVSRTQSLQ